MLDREGPVLLYVQIAEQLRARIASGELLPGSPLPSEVDLVATYGVTRQTIRRALALLKEEGAIYSSQGRGTFVGPEDAPQAPHRIPVYQQIANELIEQIKTGEYIPNRLIPSEKTLSQRFDRAAGTIRQALAYMRELGWVITVPQKGTYVARVEDWPER
ncbi:GntR family transcriptional regulator [Nonomuraea sp. NEAU-A123]|uniref:GntR family transcriptional regulator n=1 Tax=Nonomuraea sp. NEAU-A123 TaxID=2839649 RepID=UPI001BE40371|nr:GntR family transcriptional regulator [Nonomuraea sp. NEAU-A123]MBT2226000.1 GntR family transcriptional regulator [Nonomuraea sp. NEAU-A123]